MTYGFVGLGLMGGSFAKAIRRSAALFPPVPLLPPGLITKAERETARIVALDISAETLEAAKSEGIIDEGFDGTDPAAPRQMLPQCDVVFLCLYPGATLDFLIAHKGDFKAASIVTDIAGVKTGIDGHLGDFLRDDVDFILGHPMAGSEKEGFGASSPDIFRGRNYILMPHSKNRAENLTFFKALITEIGFARIIEADSATHDHKIAFTSQLCHIIACALVQSAEDTRITEFGGGSFEDLTRIAMINAPLWTELFLTNRDALLGHITAFEQVLDTYRVALEAGDAPALIEAMQGVREKRSEMTKR